ncbi:MAG: hypothetical protein EB141_09445 [Verrucomicrobia bacterium]|nr:hypothetical protein [Verrucomicrobiota bacterium]NDB75851.1 hypothetical protein [Verrucomicrobiota bacterium]NDD38001.1 hypothetical protein [Verrucomicrobiota bacterium]NDF01252.1 hypothetical protein [Verrucomicrobiota bacterium]
MPPTLAADILEHAHTHDRELYRATVNAIAGARKVRPVFLDKQPRKERHAGMIAYLSRPGLEAAAGTMLRGWLLKAHKSLLVDFLDGLGITHKDGVVDDLPDSVDDAKLKGTVEALLGKHSAEVVKVYLHSFNSMNESQWKNLEAILEDDARLQF